MKMVNEIGKDGMAMNDHMYDERQQDALQEVGNIAAASAATSLSNLLNERVMIEVTTSRVIEMEKIPTVDLYFAKKGKRYRSIGCSPCCEPVESKANTVKKIIKELETTKISERSGRAQDKEDAYTMQKLRSLGYM